MPAARFAGGWRPGGTGLSGDRSWLRPMRSLQEKRREAQGAGVFCGPLSGDGQCHLGDWAREGRRLPRSPLRDTVSVKRVCGHICIPAWSLRRRDFRLTSPRARLPQGLRSGQSRRVCRQTHENERGQGAGKAACAGVSAREQV